ncbi:MAG: tetratricopeptide repeat protein [Syntrophomonadaceae bacterium]|nr:tetratricopeptide repeat protein [Syntrophomonadaceae bacterium]
MADRFSRLNMDANARRAFLALEAATHGDAMERVVSLLTACAFLCEDGEFQEALPLLDEVLALAPRSVPALAMKAGILRHLGRWQEALEYCEQVLALDPSLAEAWRAKAVCLVKVGRYDDAVHCCEQALQAGHWS